MTTIAYKDGVIASDGQTTQDDIILQLDTDKRRMKDGVTLFGAGDVDEIEAAIERWPDVACSDVGSWSAIVIDEDGMWDAGGCHGNGWRVKHDPAVPCAIGSGMPYALAAMDMGASAKQAVKMAARRDTGTGGKIRTYKLAK
jgi:ATP-dependent protease HslVU (ClpYQ) peptidase subunit